MIAYLVCGECGHPDVLPEDLVERFTLDRLVRVLASGCGCDGLIGYDTVEEPFR